MSKVSVNKEVLQRLYNQGIKFQLNNETEYFYLINHYGDILTKEETIEVVTGLMNFIEIVNDKEIEEFNKQPILYSDYHPIRFKRPERERKRKNGHVFLYKELITNTYRFGETEDITRRWEQIVNASPVALDRVATIRVENTVYLKEYLQEIFMHKTVGNNWYSLSDEEVTTINKLHFKDDYFEWVKEKEQSYDKEEITCSECHKQVTDVTQDKYFECKYCQAVFCSEECVDEHFKTRHRDR